MPEVKKVLKGLTQYVVPLMPSSIWNHYDHH